MKRSHLSNTACALALASSALFPSAQSNAAEINMYDGEWRNGMTLYGWFPSIHLSAQYTLPNGASGSPNVNVKPGDYLGDLQFAGMVTGQARKGNWAIVYDVIYLDLASLDSTVRTVRGPGGRVELPVDVGVNSGLRSLIASLAASYTVARSEDATLDILAGARYADLKSSVDWSLAGPIGIFPQSGSAEVSSHLWDGIVGVYGRMRLSSDGKWTLPYYADIGAGNSNWTWQAYVGMSYGFGWGDVVFAYRNLSYNMNGDKPIQDLRLTGPAIGVTLRW